MRRRAAGLGALFTDLPDAQMLAMLDADPQGWVLGHPVREGGTIVDFVCEYVNQLSAKLTGRSVEDVIGHRLSQISPEAWHDGRFERYRTVA
ncbi:PAS domain-containing protein [Actinoplanes sp. NPDC049265]|uniref:PAS domain-containing protein n=1 Tax=Actinoplanes sp. NPDC049265 TaxID=3363902 RepID=UPI00371CEA57